MARVRYIDRINSFSKSKWTGLQKPFSFLQKKSIYKNNNKNKQKFMKKLVDLEFRIGDAQEWKLGDFLYHQQNLSKMPKVNQAKISTKYRKH